MLIQKLEDLSADFLESSRDSQSQPSATAIGQKNRKLSNQQEQQQTSEIKFGGFGGAASAENQILFVGAEKNASISEVDDVSRLSFANAIFVDLKSTRFSLEQEEKAIEEST